MGGILATIITGFILWWLTGPLSPFVKHSSASHSEQGQSSDGKSSTDGSTTAGEPIKPEPVVELKAVIAISAFNLKSPINIGESTTSNFDVTNNGNATATGCQLIWNTPGLNGAKTSDQFNLSPGETKSFQLVSNSFDKDGTYNTEASVSCGNTTTVSDSKPLVVNFMMSAPKKFPDQ